MAVTIAARVEPNMSLLLRGGCVVTLDPARRVFARGDVMIEHGQLAAIGERVAAAADETIDCTGCLVLPGLVQAHVHLCQTLARGRADDAPLLDWLRGTIWPYEAALRADDVRAAAELGCAELLLSGTTAILDMGTVHHQDQVFAACARAGIRAASGKAMMDAGAEVPAGLCETTAGSLAESDRLAKEWHGKADGRLRYAYAPRFVLSATEDLLRAVAARGGLVHSHASENRDECAAVRAQTGCDNIEYLERVGLLGGRTVLAHCVWVSERERALLAQTGTSVAHCPGSNAKLGSGIAPVVELLAAGVNVALGADGAPCNNRLSGFAEMRLAVQLQRARAGANALSAQTALELATLGGALALGLGHEIGSLEPGKRADVIVVAADAPTQAPLGANDPHSTLVFATSAAEVRDVIVDGRVCVRERRLTTLALPDVLARARACADRLFP
jgi:cytosine/adenosine deaminase-related metal-dependent hydrolase